MTQQVGWLRWKEQTADTAEYLTKDPDFFFFFFSLQKSIKDTRKEKREKKKKERGRLTGRHKHNYSYYIFFLKWLFVVPPTSNVFLRGGPS